MFFVKVPFNFMVTRIWFPRDFRQCYAGIAEKLRPETDTELPQGRLTMLDGYMRTLIDPPLDRAGAILAGYGISANAVTFAGLAFGLGAALAIALGDPLWGLPLILLSRVCDGLDGAVARATRRTDFGGFLDIVADFAFYGAIPLGFAFAVPEANALAAAFLVVSYYVNGASFLGYAILAEKHGKTTRARGLKSLYFTGGLLEGTETIVLFVSFCLWPDLFPLMAWLFGAATLVTAVSRIVLAYQVFGRS